MIHRKSSSSQMHCSGIRRSHQRTSGSSEIGMINDGRPFSLQPSNRKNLTPTSNTKHYFQLFNETVFCVLLIPQTRPKILPKMHIHFHKWEKENGKKIQKHGQIYQTYMNAPKCWTKICKTKQAFIEAYPLFGWLMFILYRSYITSRIFNIYSMWGSYV